MSSRAPDDAQVRQLQSIQAALSAGRAHEVVAQARQLAIRLSGFAPAQHLLALCLKSSGELMAARAAFETATRLAPTDAKIRGNLANTLAALGSRHEAIAQYETALRLDPSMADVWLNLGLTALDAHDVERSRTALERSIALSPRASRAWQALGALYRQVDDPQRAVHALEKAISLHPDDGRSWLALSVAQRLAGDPQQALESSLRARACGTTGPELLDATSAAQLDLGEIDAARSTVERLVTEAPQYAAGHVMRCEILWEHDETGELALAELGRHALNEPRQLALQQAYAQFNNARRRYAVTANHLAAVRREHDDPTLVALHADALLGLGELDAAYGLYADSVAFSAHPVWRRGHVRQLLRAGAPDEARGIAEGALQGAPPFDQEMLAYLATAWRLLGDARAHWLCDPDILIREVHVDVDDLIDTLRATLVQLHSAKREPLRQSLRNGSQTSGALLGRPIPVIREIARRIQTATRAALAALPEDLQHPFLSRNTKNFRYAGSWSVALRSSGYHAHHYHQDGWLSSAFYVSVPDCVARATTTNDAGCLQFGVPDEALGIALPPLRTVRPEAGKLALFPSYFWHGTVPFVAGEPRVTIAFDAQPK